MKLERPLISLDIESTGLSLTQDRIVDLALVILRPESPLTETLHWRFNPGFPMKPEVIAIHGITDELVADGPAFSAHAADIHSRLQGCDLAGYNCLKFDLPLLWEELYRCGIHWSLDGVRVIDAGNIFKKMEPRDLSAAVRKYAGREHEGAHGAVADADATLAVIHGQLEEYPAAFSTVEEMAAFSKMEDTVDVAGKLCRDANGEVCYAFGEKTRGVPVKRDPGFGHWMMNKDFPQSTKLVLGQILNELGEEGYP